MKTNKSRSPRKTKRTEAPTKLAAPRKAKRAGTSWEDLEAKRKAYLKIMRAILDNPELGPEYVGSDQKAREAFAKAGMDVPTAVKVVFVPSGDSAVFGAGSAVIELPDATGGSYTDEELLDLFLCTYTIAW
jgi:precorrin-3B methylase